MFCRVLEHLIRVFYHDLEHMRWVFYHDREHLLGCSTAFYNSQPRVPEHLERCYRTLGGVF